MERRRAAKRVGLQRVSHQRLALLLDPLTAPGLTRKKIALNPAEESRLQLRGATERAALHQP
jgi:hypothetical protein